MPTPCTILPTNRTNYTVYALQLWWKKIPYVCNLFLLYCLRLTDLDRPFLLKRNWFGSQPSFWTIVSISSKNKLVGNLKSWFPARAKYCGTWSGNCDNNLRNRFLFYRERWRQWSICRACSGLLKRQNYYSQFAQGPGDKCYWMGQNRG